MPRITVITPVFDGIRYISGCVENVQSQNFDGLEHLIVDGGSMDGTVERLSELAAQFPQLRFISEKDAGQSDAMNKGIGLAKSEIIGFLNCDDFYEPGAIREAVDFLDRHPEVDFVAGNLRIIDETGALVELNVPNDLRLESLLLGKPLASFPQNPSAYFYRKKIHTVVGEYDISEHHALDLAFIYACAANIRMAHVPRLWGNYRMLPDTKTYIDERLGTASGRREKLRSLWLARLSPAQRRRMQVLKYQKRLRAAVEWFFHAVGRRLDRWRRSSVQGHLQSKSGRVERP